MSKEIRLNTITWIALVIIISISFVFSENVFTHTYLLIAIFSIVKFLTICFQFVEVKHAHLVWKLVSIFFALVYLIGIIALN